jgi:hypothetical protein
MKLFICFHCGKTVNPHRTSKSGWWCPSCKVLNRPSADTTPLNRRSFILQTLDSGLRIAGLGVGIANLLKVQHTITPGAQNVTVEVGSAVMTAFAGSLDVSVIRAVHNPPKSRLPKKRKVILSVLDRRQVWESRMHPKQASLEMRQLKRLAGKRFSAA